METLVKIPTKKQDEIHAREYLLDLLKDNDRIYYKINHVAKSGMSRSISFYVATTDKWDNHRPIIQNITGLMATIKGKRLDSYNGYRVVGCGMDMGFNEINNLSMALYCPDKYEHEKAYRLKAQQI